MNGALLFAVSALVLSVERVAYVWVWHRPEHFRRIATTLGLDGDPVEALRSCFGLFKVLQATVFLAWAANFGFLDPFRSLPLAVAALGLVLVGQTLNALVFRRLGAVGVFYGNRFGHEVPWCDAFPFSTLRHPQYTGTVLSIWGLFLLMRFPHPDWWAIPALESVYYVLGAHYER